MNDMTEMPAPLVFTDSAAEKVKSLIEEEGNPELKLRVFVTGGGCSGFQYGFTFDEVVNEDDTAMVKNGVTLLIDPMSYQYLVGAEIDYSGRPRGRAVRHQEPERDDDLRLRVELFRLKRSQARRTKRGLRGPVLLGATLIRRTRPALLSLAWISKFDQRPVVHGLDATSGRSRPAPAARALRSLPAGCRDGRRALRARATRTRAPRRGRPPRRAPMSARRDEARARAPGPPSAPRCARRRRRREPPPRRRSVRGSRRRSSSRSARRASPGPRPALCSSGRDAGRATLR